MQQDIDVNIMEIQCDYSDSTQFSIQSTYLENLGIHGILDTGGKILETGGIFGELRKILKIWKKNFFKWKKIEMIRNFKNERNEEKEIKDFWV